LPDLPNVPDRQEMLDRAAQIAPELEKRAQATNELRKLHPESFALIRDAGMFRMLQPRRLGGYELDLNTFNLVTRELAKACPSTAWVLGVSGAHTWILAMYPEACQDAIAAVDPETFIPGALTPQGRATPAEGGMRVSGQWQFASGVNHGAWAMFGASLASTTTERPTGVHFFVPRSDLTIVDTWHSMGLRGTGSNDVVLDDVFVPDHMILPDGQLFANGTEYAKRHETLGYSCIPIFTGLAFILTGPVIGIAETALGAFVERTLEWKDVFIRASKAHRVQIQVRLAQAQDEIRSAKARVAGVMELFDHLIAEGRRATTEERILAKWQICEAGEACKNAVDRLFVAAGSHSVFDDSVLQRAFRDLHVAKNHSFLDIDLAREMRGRVELGLDPGTPLF
jgi:3-hydroxy-9,10-secoandrosta-1,3,5(10)-triene-9,17-dione monooxygenase